MSLSYEEVKAKVLEQVPTVCPICGGHLTLSKNLMHLTCDNPNCDGKVKRKLEIGAKALGIDNIGPGVATELCEHLGITNVYQLYDLTEQDFLKVPRYQDGMAKKLYQSIQAAKEVTFPQFIRACQFYRVGDGTSNEIAGAYIDLNDLLGSSAVDFVKRLGGMSQDVGNQIWESVIGSKENVVALSERVTIKYPQKAQVGGNPTGKQLVCVVTGPLGFGTRPEFQEHFGANYNVKWGTSVSKNTDILVTNETTPTGKYKKAKQLQSEGSSIQILNEEEFLAYIGADATSTAQARVEANRLDIENVQSYGGVTVEL